MPWIVVLDIGLVQSLAGWDRRNRNELLVIKRLLESGGPEALDWDAPALTGAPLWELIGEPYRRGYWTAVGEHFYWLSLEVLPGRAIRIWEARCGVSPHWKQ